MWFDSDNACGDAEIYVDTGNSRGALLGVVLTLGLLAACFLVTP